jgi:hypothetical protein
MVSDNHLWDVEPCYYLVENKESCCLAIIIKCRHSFDPLCEVVYHYDDITMPLYEIGWHVVKLIPHLVKGPTIMTGKMVEGCALIFKRRSDTGGTS